MVLEWGREELCDGEWVGGWIPEVLFSTRAGG